MILNRVGMCLTHRSIHLISTKGIPRSSHRILWWTRFLELVAMGEFVPKHFLWIPILQPPFRSLYFRSEKRLPEKSCLFIKHTDWQQNVFSSGVMSRKSILTIARWNHDMIRRRNGADLGFPFSGRKNITQKKSYRKATTLLLNRSRLHHRKNRHIQLLHFQYQFKLQNPLILCGASPNLRKSFIPKISTFCERKWLCRSEICILFTRRIRRSLSWKKWYNYCSLKSQRHESNIRKTIKSCLGWLAPITPIWNRCTFYGLFLHREKDLLDRKRQQEKQLTESLLSHYRSTVEDQVKDVQKRVRAERWGDR